MPALRTHSLCWSGCWTEQGACSDTFSFLACLKISPVPLHSGLAVPVPGHHCSDGPAGPGHLWGCRSSSGWGWLWDHIPPLLWQGSLLNDFDQPLPPLSPGFRESFCLRCMVGFEGSWCEINKCQHRLLWVSQLTRNPCVPSANKGCFPQSWATTKEQVFSPEMPWRFVCS